MTAKFELTPMHGASLKEAVNGLPDFDVAMFSGAAGGFAAKAEEARKTEATARSLMVFVMMCSDCVVARVRP